MTPPVNLVLINPQRKAEINEENRRLISRVAPVCLAYNLHLWLVDFGIKTNPIEFAKEIAPSTSIGESGENLIQLCGIGRVKITNTPLPQNIGQKILCTNMPEDSKLKRINEIVNLSKQKSIALIFGINQKNNKVLKKIKDDAYGHLDITNKKIRLSLDSEIGAVCHSFFITRKV